MRKVRITLAVVLLLLVTVLNVAVLGAGSPATKPGGNIAYQAGNTLVIEGQVAGCSCPVTTGNCMCRIATK